MFAQMGLVGENDPGVLIEAVPKPPFILPFSAPVQERLNLEGGHDRASSCA